MLKKARSEMSDDGPKGEAKDLTQGVLDSSRQIWLAGLGAFSRAQQEGMKMFEKLVDQGERLESRTRKVAVDTAALAKGAATAKAKEMHAKAGGTWDRLEQVFEDRVAKALSKLGVHTQSDVDRLAQRVDALSEAVNELIKSSGGSVVAKRAARTGTTGRKSVAKSKDSAARTARKSAKGRKTAAR